MPKETGRKKSVNIQPFETTVIDYDNGAIDVEVQFNGIRDTAERDFHGSLLAQIDDSTTATRLTFLANRTYYSNYSEFVMSDNCQVEVVLRGAGLEINIKSHHGYRMVITELKRVNHARTYLMSFVPVKIERKGSRFESGEMVTNLYHDLNIIADLASAQLATAERPQVIDVVIIAMDESDWMIKSTYCVQMPPTAFDLEILLELEWYGTHPDQVSINYTMMLDGQPLGGLKGDGYKRSFGTDIFHIIRNKDLKHKDNYFDGFERFKHLRT